MAGANNVGHHSGAVYSVLSTPNHAGAEPLDFDRCARDEPSELSPIFNWRTISKKMEHKTIDVFKNRNLLVDLLAIFFGIGTWLGVNGTFIQLPLLVNEAPEGWSLPSYLSVMVQIGNLGPLLYTVYQKYSPWKLNDGLTIHAVLAIGTLSCLLTAFVYNQTASLAGNEHSVALFVLTIFTALNACTSSVLFMPYMGRFKEQYMVMYFIGEGLSGLLPSVTALVQGIGDTGRCVLVNVTESGEEIYQKETQPPLFDTKLFFLILFGLMVLSYIGYTLLNALPVARREYADVTVSKGNKYEYSQDGNQQLSRGQYAALLVLIGSISLFSNGMFPSIQSYSSAPYGTRAYHLAATLSVIANPVACFMAMFLHFTSLRIIYLLSSLAALLTSYVFTTAVLSPYPPLYDETIGVVLVVTAWTLLIGVVSYTKLGITTVMRSQGGQSLVWVGGITQLGSAIGAISIFFAINYTRFFQAAESLC
ncbi:solute carrier family 52, riboflavin transporter, member 3-A [Drosophila grimshawi]|uniref:Riboflavin transporter n=1 Tax=Drosophila grimshawi TaxID=7222 RepID=B4JTR6_DROGR|nr:solute carrier family 52, riboflavin transporter, member 3-A [Drosophila grimshawi]XP_032596485.1 solute carrier family 52, riboflavin transporter, member 3-A [Drosophila grimshawi]EDV91495.1 GH17475 [Drosophila grimshawi]